MSTTSATITIRTDQDTKAKAKALFGDLGMDMSTAVNAFLHQSVRENRVPFELTRDVPNAETIAAINDQITYGPFTTVEELMESLDADY